MKRVPFCSKRCGRRVWNFETGLCGRCDPSTRRMAERQSWKARARHERARLLGDSR